MKKGIIIYKQYFWLFFILFERKYVNKYEVITLDGKFIEQLSGTPTVECSLLQDAIGLTVSTSIKKRIAKFSYIIRIDTEFVQNRAEIERFYDVFLCTTFSFIIYL